MMLGADGLLYGTCNSWNGNPNRAVIFQYDPSELRNGLMVVYHFPINGLGYLNPTVLTLGTDGNLDGTAQETGTSIDGTVFQFNPTTKKLTTLHNFQGSASSDGANPAGLLVLGTNGDLYGTTTAGGISGGSNGGTFYSIATKGKIKILYSFNTFANPTSGYYPSAGVTLGNNGSFYGVTFNGGTSAQGTAFEITPAGKITWLHNFNETTDNAGFPIFPLTLGGDGNLYRAATNNGGVEIVFEIATKPVKKVYTYTDLYNFPTPSSPTATPVPPSAAFPLRRYCIALVRRGEATAAVTATGVHTKFGRTAELVRTAHAASSQQKAVLRIVRNLAIFNGGVILIIGAYAYFHAMPWSELVPLLLTSVLAAIPVALPATFTLAAALGARSLAKRGVLPTRLSAVDEAATIDVLCSDKTGTLTCNDLSISSVKAMTGFDEAHILGMAALASSEGGDDSVDAAIRSASAHNSASDLPKLITFVPFDPAKKTSEATATDANGGVELIIKGAFTVVASLTAQSPTAAGLADGLEKQGFRVLAVAAG
jgi:uncharacterized repeat protein (TIGR03803 family)